MDTQQDCLLQFDRDLLSGKNICSSRGVFVTFPSSLKKLFHMKGLGVIICHQGSFRFSLNQKSHYSRRWRVSGTSGIGKSGSADSDLPDRAYPGHYG